MVALNVQCSMFNSESPFQLATALLVAAVIVARVTTLCGFVVVGNGSVGCYRLWLSPTSVATRQSSCKHGSALAAPSVQFNWSLQLTEQILLHCLLFFWHNYTSLMSFKRLDSLS